MHRVGAVLAIAGTLVYVTATVLHGNPPIEDAARILDHVAARPWWRAKSLANILAVLLWLGALSALTEELPRGLGRSLGRLSQAVLACTSAVFAVYFSIHGFGFETLADGWATATPSARADLVVETNAVLTLLGSTAFTAQALLGLSILLYGLTMLFSTGYPRWLGWVGIVAGAGWAVGAVLVDFAVIVPFTVLAWGWMMSIGVLLWRRPSTGSEVGGS